MSEVPLKGSHYDAEAETAHLNPDGSPKARGDRDLPEEDEAVVGSEDKETGDEVDEETLVMEPPTGEKKVWPYDY